NEKARQGWLPGHPPFGYRNVTGNKDEPIQVNPDDGPTVQRIFELYSRGDTTFNGVADTLAAEGRRHSPSRLRFSETTLSYILNNRFYIGELEWQGQRHPGLHKTLVDRATFERCQDIMKGRTRRTGTPTIPYGGGLFRCGVCGKAMIGEEIKRKLRNGGANTHYYYKCHGSGKDGHPNVRCRQEDMEARVARDLEGLKIDAEAAGWIRKVLGEGFRDEEAARRDQRGRWLKRRSEVKGMLERLLNGYLGGAIDEAVFKEKSVALKVEEAELGEKLAGGPGAGMDAEAEKWALATLDFSQNAAEIWHGSTFGNRRAILDCLWSNRTLTTETLTLTRRKPSDALVEGPLWKIGRGNWRSFEPFTAALASFREAALDFEAFTASGTPKNDGRPW
ncbi:MAG: recombinase family protein, partial [Planctomycetes bacterium]|nr:recombinase family protein [Planctomycetota bacterium]